MLLVAGGAVAGSPQSAQAAPGTPGIPQQGATLFAEGFENRTGTAPVNLTAYTGANGQRYTAAPGWLTGCNGQIVSFQTPHTSLGNCASTAYTSATRQLAWALGAHVNSGSPQTNDAVTAYTQNNPGANEVEFATASNIQLAAASGRYLTFSADAAAMNCNVSAPVYQFSLVDASGDATPVGGQINACTSSKSVTAPAIGPRGATAIRVGTYTSNGSVLVSGPSVGIRMTNANGSGVGNDAAFDNIRILDVTPQLDKSFSPTSMYQGQTSTLTFTVTNTTERASKNGWSFTDELPAGLTVASPADAVTDCPAGVLTAPAGGTSVSLAGDLSAGMAACTATVSVTASDPGSYSNGPDNVTSTGLNAPATSTLTVTTSPTFTCDAFGYLFQSPNGAAGPHQIVQVDLATGENAVFAGMPAQANAIGFNELDGYFYGIRPADSQLIRIATDGSQTALGSGVASVIGDVDPDGFLWLHGGETWYQYDLRPGSPTYAAQLDSGPLTIPGTWNSIGFDWTFIDGALYRLATTAAGQVNLLRFDVATKATTDDGVVTGLPAYVGSFGATYADAAGYLYGSFNETGDIVRVDPATLAGIVATDGPPSGSNDGARCASAPIPTLTVEKQVVDRLATDDQFTVGIVDGTGDDVTSATTVGADASASTVDWPVSQGGTYTITDAMAPGSANTLDAYAATVACVDGDGGPVTAVAEPGVGWTIDIDSPTDYTCTITNTGQSAPGLDIVKSASPTDAFTVGQAIEYSFVVTNTGNTTLTGVAVNEESFSGTGELGDLECTPAGTTLEPGGQLTCSAAYELTQADVDAGQVVNSATATGTPPSGPPIESPPSEVEIPVAPAAAVSLEKSVTPATGILVAGDELTYAFLVTNEGNVTLTDVGIVEGAFSGTGDLSAIDCPTAPLLPGQQATCTATYELTQADVDAGQVTNDATATATTPAAGSVSSDPSDAEVVVSPRPAITVVKSATPDGGGLAPGDEITYSFVVTNTGTVTLDDIVVDDDDFSGTGTLSAIVCGTTTLAPDAQTTCTATNELTDADIDAGEVTNAATVTGTPPSGPPPVSPPSEVTIDIDPEPGITVVKSATPEGGVLSVGDEITYSFLVTNTGNVTLTDVVVGESEFSGAGTLPPVACPAGAASLGAGETVTCTTSYELTQADVDAGGIVNSAVATGTPPSGPPPVSPPSEVTIDIDPEPGISVVKSATPSSAEEFTVGQEIVYSFVVTNTGNVTLADVTIDEQSFSGTGELSEIVCAETTLAPDTQTTCTATYELTQADVDSGEVSNAATATGTPPGGGTPPESPPSEVEIPTPPAPGISVVKSATPDSGALEVGDEILYSFVVTNTGNVTLTDVTVDEGEFTGSGPLSAVVCPAEAASVIPGAFVTCTATYVLTTADVDGGAVSNSATATGTPPSGPPPVSPPSEVTIDIDPEPGIEVVKSADPATGAEVGDTVTYSFRVTNSGNVTLTDVAVTEEDFSGTGDLSEIVCPAEAASLAAGEVVTCVATYELTQADVDAGEVTNVATATGTPPSGPPPVSPPSEVVIELPPAPAISVVKSAVPNSLDEFQAGQEIVYSFVVTNTGNVTLTDVTVDDTGFSGTGPLPPVVCPAEAASVAPGAQVVCSTTYTLTQADVDAGEVTNAATATGTPPSGPPPVSPPSEVTIPTPPLPAISVVKTADADALVEVGQEIAYAFEVTNTGNVTLTDVTVDEVDFSGDGPLGAVVCPADAGELIPGQVIECTATYTVTQADLDSGELVNVASASGQGPGGGARTVAPESDVEIPFVGEAGLELAKSASVTDVNGNGITDPGDRVSWTFTVVNIGIVTITDITVSDPTAGEVACIATLLPPGAQMSCAAVAERVITAADAARGSIVNVASALGTGPDGIVESDEAEAVVEVEPTPADVAVTGTVIAGGVTAALALLITGGVLLLGERRRRFAG